MDDYILEMRSITKTFPGVKALSDVNLKVRRGEIHAICGENGAGKSTLMKVLSGVYPAGTYEGEIVYDGEVQKFGGIRDSEHVGIVIIHQELALVPYLSIAENLFLGNEPEANDTETYDNGVKVVPSYLLDVETVFADDIQSVLIDSGYWTADEVTKGQAD